MAGLCLYQSSPGPMPPEPPAPEPPPIPVPSSSSSSTAVPEPSARLPEPSPEPCAETVDATADESVDVTGASMSNSELPSMSIRPGSMTIFRTSADVARTRTVLYSSVIPIHCSWSFSSALRWCIIIISIDERINDNTTLETGDTAGLPGRQRRWYHHRPSGWSVQEQYCYSIASSVPTSRAYHILYNIHSKYLGGRRDPRIWLLST